MIQKLKEIRKAITAFSGSALTVIALVVPSYSDEAQYGVGLAIALLTAAITYRVPNAPKA